MGAMDTPTPSDFFRRHAALEAEICEKRARRAASARLRAEARAWAFGGLCEATEGLAVVWRREGTPLAAMLAWADGDLFTLNMLARWLRLGASYEINRLRHAERRPAYYEKEKARRQALAAGRRSTMRRITSNPCPTKEQILDAWLKVGNSHADLLRFGSLMEDLACYVDSSPIRTEDGEIVGRRGGVKAWLQVNIPALYLKYKTVMAYKVAARKVKEITGLADPTPAARLVEAPQADEPLEVVRARAVYLEVMGTPPAAQPKAGTAAPDGTAARGGGTAPDGTTAQGKEAEPGGTAAQGREAAARTVPRTRTAWLDRVAAFADPGRVTEATTLAVWRAKYETEITVRTKSRWLARLKVRVRTGAGGRRAS